MHIDQNCHKILRKLQKVIKFGENASHKAREQLLFWTFSENWKIDRKRWENDSGLIS